ncbi:transposase domain-containing protein [Streptomyces sp. NPDC004232]|uniref:transposase domain-containing protein n=1 Tax=Streptomyces sp. NPDC004232 TaxID=3154454 RepID=UPI0033AAD913
MPCEPADAVLTAARTVQRRLRHLPPRVGYFLFAMCLFPEVGYRPVRDELTAGPARTALCRSTARRGFPTADAPRPGWCGHLITAASHRSR